ncbi:MAG: hypothetical protein KGL35_10855 [Bradyrhizobium sp.]|nr:hypothetical protein [Bradyrhizobium sp.]
MNLDPQSPGDGINSASGEAMHQDAAIVSLGYRERWTAVFVSRTLGNPLGLTEGLGVELRQQVR